MNIENGKNFTVRKAKKEDFFRVFEYIQSTTEYKMCPEDARLSLADFENLSICGCILAENLNKNIVGLVIYFPRYSTWIGRFLCVEIFHVTDDFKNLEIVKRLAKEIAKEARKNNVKYVDFILLKRNLANNYYKLLGATKVTEIERYDNYRFNEEIICKLIEM